MSQTSEKSIKEIIIVGGGSAGWMTAAALSRLLQPEHIQVTVVESEHIGTIGVGEATIPDIINFNRILGIPEDEFMRATNATFKLGIEFENWGKIGERYFHPFGQHGADMQGIDFHQFFLSSKAQGNSKTIEDYSLCALAAKQNKFQLPSADPRNVLSQIRYAYHFDATLYARLLRSHAESRGVKRIEGKVENIGTQTDTGFIESLTLESGKTISGDFFFDCTGFRALLLSKTLDVKFKDWTHWLPCNSAQAIACEHNGPLLPYTKAKAKSEGWQWRIPTQKRTGNGYIYSNEFISDDNATDVLISDLDGAAIGAPKQLRFKTGCREAFWEKNCVAIGLSAGFLEPLESTSIYLIQMGISRFISMFPGSQHPEIVAKEYNRHMSLLYDQVRDFIILHYCATNRDDSDFWNYCRNMSLPDSLVHKMELFKSAGRVFRYEDELFSKPSWVAVLLGQGIIPETVDPIVSSLPRQQLDKSLRSMHHAMQTAATNMPSHEMLIQKYCSSEC